MHRGASYVVDKLNTEHSAECTVGRPTRRALFVRVDFMRHFLLSRGPC
jgi:hypothetical protein